MVVLVTCVALGGYDIESLNIPTVQQYTRQYAEFMSVNVVDNWNFYMSFVLFRSAAIAQGVYKRFTLGLRNALIIPNTPKAHLLTYLLCCCCLARFA